MLAKLEGNLEHLAWYFMTARMIVIYANPPIDRIIFPEDEVEVQAEFKKNMASLQSLRVKHPKLRLTLVTQRDELGFLGDKNSMTLAVEEELAEAGIGYERCELQQADYNVHRRPPERGGLPEAMALCVRGRWRRFRASRRLGSLREAHGSCERRGGIRLRLTRECHAEACRAACAGSSCGDPGTGSSPRVHLRRCTQTPHPSSRPCPATVYRLQRRAESSSSYSTVAVIRRGASIGCRRHLVSAS